MRRVLIADSSDIFIRALAPKLDGLYEIATCSSGYQAVHAIRMFRPDILLLDMQMPGMDGLAILNDVLSDGYSPVILATMRIITDYIQDSLARLNVAYIMVKPCQINAVVERIRDMERMLLQGEHAVWDAATEIDSRLMALGFRPNLAGYRCTVEAILALVRDPELAISKGVYPAVVPVCGTTVKQVEHAIRLAINDAWKHRDEAAWSVYFPKGTDGTIRRPTNSVFLTRMATALKACKK